MAPKNTRRRLARKTRGGSDDIVVADLRISRCRTAAERKKNLRQVALYEYARRLGMPRDVAELDAKEFRNWIRAACNDSRSSADYESEALLKRFIGLCDDAKKVLDAESLRQHRLLGGDKDPGNYFAALDVIFGAAMKPAGALARAWCERFVRQSLARDLIVRHFGRGPDGHDLTDRELAVLSIIAGLVDDDLERRLGQSPNHVLQDEAKSMHQARLREQRRSRAAQERDRSYRHELLAPVGHLRKSGLLRP